VIKNNGGVFVVQPFDDSTTICANYFERDIRDWLLTPTVKNVFVDIGANRGIYSIRAPQKYGYQTVHALEPNKEMFDVLTRNIQLNKLEEIVTCHNLAAGKETSTVQFSVDPMHKGGGKIVSATDSDTFDVSVASLDTILQAVPAQEISFIKIDTEGFEFDVLSGMTAVLNGMTTGACMMIETTELMKLVTLLKPFNFILAKSQNEDHLFIKKAQS
jgi:FkbM family methyltransferase